MANPFERHDCCGIVHRNALLLATNLPQLRLKGDRCNRAQPYQDGTPCSSFVGMAFGICETQGYLERQQQKANTEHTQPER